MLEVKMKKPTHNIMKLLAQGKIEKAKSYQELQKPENLGRAVLISRNGSHWRRAVVDLHPIKREQGRCLGIFYEESSVLPVPTIVKLYPFQANSRDKNVKYNIYFILDKNMLEGIKFANNKEPKGIESIQRV